MLHVFVSRPTWVPDEFRQGLDHFLDLLDKMALKPRTLGSTDYPTRCPLDEVIHLMDECRGAVILGYPQIIVSSGTLKNAQLSADLPLPTEWNHIEAGLAYARDLPLLVIHHTGIRRGIFDRGAIGGFLYELDLSNPMWPLDTAVSGALTSWKASVLEPRRSAPPQGTASPPRRQGLSNDLLRVLTALAQPGQDELETAQVSRILGLSEQMAQYYLDQLYEAELIERACFVSAATQYFLQPAGRAALAERGLL